jgi:chromosome partitioning protein
MRIWAFVQQKGGAGKSTLSTQLSVYAEQCGEAVVLVDLDPQGSAVAWSNVRGTRQPAVLPATPDKVHELIEKAPMFGATLIIIDTAPHSDSGAVAAIRAADLIICPTQPSLFDVAALKDTVCILELCETKSKAVCVVNGLPHQGAQAAYLEAVAAVESLGLKALKAHIGHRRPFAVSIQKGKGVTESHKTDQSAKEIRALWSELNALAPIKITKKKEHAR